MINILKYIAILMFVFSAGCSSKYAITYDSNPQGATLVCSGKNWGYTPKVLYYDNSIKERSTVNVSDCSANWVSGFTKSYPSNLRIFPEGGTLITLGRPSGDGYTQDAEFALKVQNMQYQKRQAEAAESSAYQQLYQNTKTTTCIKNYNTTTCF